MFLRLMVLSGVIGAGVSLAQQTSARVVLLRDVRLIDGTGSLPREHISLLLRDGRIAAVGAADMAVPTGATVVELHGKTVIPGLISAHSHLGLMIDNVESSATAYTRENVTTQLKQFEQYGVTTIMSLGVNRDLVYELREEQRAGRLGGATIYTAGRGIGVPGGAPGLPAAADQIYRPKSVNEAREDVDELAAHHADIVKIWVDKQHGTAPEMSPEMYRAVIDEAHGKHLRVAAHEYALEDAKRLVADGVDVLAHSVRDEVVDDAFVQAMKRRGVWYVPTFTVDESLFIYADRPEFMQSEFFRQAAGHLLMAKLDAPDYPKKINDDPQTMQHRKDFAIGQQNLKKLFDAGVNVGFGTDSGALPGRIPGFAEHRELELMVRAGLTPMQAITAATGENAKLLHSSDRGTIAVGKRADLVVLDANPLIDIRNTRKIVSVYHDGQNVTNLPGQMR